MRDGAPTDVLAGDPRWEPRVQSWLGGALLAGGVPVQRGRLVRSVRDRTRTEVRLTVPGESVVDGRPMVWVPGVDPLHPLARYGQTLDVSVLVRSEVSGTEWLTRCARAMIVDWDEQPDGSVQVVARGVLRRVDDSKITSLTQPATGSTLASEGRRLMPLGVTLAVDAALPDRGVPASMVWSTDRYQALTDIAEAWPALVRDDEWGQVYLRAPLPDIPTPILTLTDGERGTLVSAPRSDTRDGAYNEVIASSSAPGSEGVRAVYSQPSGPMAVTGPYGAVTREWASPLLTTSAQALAAARTMVANSLQPARVVTVTHAPDPRIDLDDPVEVVRWAGTDREERSWGYVIGTDMPLTALDGAQRTDVALTA